MAEKMEVAASCVDSLIKAGMDKAESALLLTRKTELNVDSGEFSLMRTTDDVNLRLMGIQGGKKGSTSINKTDAGSIESAVSELGDLVESSEPDPAADIAENQPEESFSRGPQEPDLDLMYSRMSQFLKRTSTRYPTLILEQLILDHTLKLRYYSNSNGVKFSSARGEYNFVAMFTSKDGENTSSFNFSGVSGENLDRELNELGTIDLLMKQSTEQTVTENLPETFTGDVIVTPDCLGDFVNTITGHLNDYLLMTGTSIFKDSLGKKIADERFTLRSMPLSEKLSGGYFFTGDGFKAENSTIIENGVLKTFLLSLYGSNKTGQKKAVNSGNYYVVDPGTAGFEDMVKSVDRGILLCRFSGGNPASNGDFSGVAKNSYYIENGEIKYPVSETMVAGNIKEMFNSIKSISSETVNNGATIFPWISFTGITVSGK